jgi:hypothetical protein
MAVPSTNISMSAIYGEANAGSPPSDLAVSDLFKLSYFESNAFGGSITFNAWGQYGNASGANRIYGLSASNSNNNFNQFATLVYYYDNSTYANYVSASNNLPPPAPPSPPFNNDITVFCRLYDSTGAYVYSQFQQTLGAGFNANQIFSNTTEPILAIAYWEVEFQPFSGAFGGATCNISINGTSKVSSGTINASGNTVFSYSTLGSVNQASNTSGYIGTLFDIAIN